MNFDSIKVEFLRFQLLYQIYAIILLLMDIVTQAHFFQDKRPGCLCIKYLVKNTFQITK